jgi:hypothetical protein
VESFLGFVVLFLLSALAAAAALAIACRARLPGRAALVVAASLLWNAIILLPIYVLGLLGYLTARSLGAASVLVSAGAFAIASRGVGLAPMLRQTGEAALGVLRLPLDALAICWRQRSLVTVGVAFAMALLPYIGLSAWLAQPLPHWDPLWYHDTMVGLTIQNHGFAMVDLPVTLQKVNGYVRLAEMTQLWMSIFADRRLADMTNLLFAPLLAASTYMLARRYAGKVPSIGWAVAVLLVPTNIGFLHSTYVDPQYGALLLGAIVFSTVSRPTFRDAGFASLALALTIGSKGLALVTVPLTGVVGAWLFLREHWQDRRRAAIATVAAGVLGIAIVASTTYLRNYWAFHNPFWPDLRVDIAALGIHWPGTGPWIADAAGQGPPVNLNEPFSQLLDQWYARPWSVNSVMYEQAAEYGIGVTWVIFPLGVFAFFACLATAIRRGLHRRLERAQGTRDTPAPAGAPPLPIALILAGMVAGSPALWTARYHIAGVAMLAGLIAWMTGPPKRERLGESAVSAVLLMSIMMFWWTPPPRWWFTPEQLLKLAQVSPVEREVDRALGAPTVREPGLARERELGPGTLLVFSDRYSGFPSIFWNRSFSNRVLYLRMGPDFLARAARAGASWIFVLEPGIIAQARAPGSGWQEVGPLNGINGGGLAFRRIPVTAPPKTPAPPAKAPPAPPILGPVPPPTLGPAPPPTTVPRPIILPPGATGLPQPARPVKPATPPTPGAKTPPVAPAAKPTAPKPAAAAKPKPAIAPTPSSK